jgi:hypothetical protein
MERIKLDLEHLAVDSFEAAAPDLQASVYSAPLGPGGYCCTGCDSGCGYNPTALGCESGANDTALAAY